MEVLLKDFVRETVNEIIEGIVGAQNDMLSKYTKTEDPSISISAYGTGYSKIDFDVSITTNINSETSGKAGVSIKVVDVGVNTTKSTENKNENRIKFSVLFTVSDVNNFQKVNEITCNSYTPFTNTFV